MGTRNKKKWWRLSHTMLFSLLLLWVVVAATANEQQQQQPQHTATTDEHNHEEPRPSSSSSQGTRSSATVRAAAPAVATRVVLPLKSVVDPHNVSLAERLKQSTGDKNFEDRLRQELTTRMQPQTEQSATTPRLQRSSSQQTSQATAPKFSSSSSWYWMASLVLLFGAATLTSPATVWPEIQTTLSKVMSLQALSAALTYVQQAGSAVRYLNVLWMAHLLLGQQQAGGGFIQAWRAHVWPAVSTTARKLLVAEVWTFLWKLVEEPWQWMFSTPTASTANDRNGDDPPSWWQAALTRTSKVLHKGGSKLIKALMRKQIDDFVVTLLSQGVTFLKDAASARTTLT